MYTEKWNEICFLLSENVKKEISENAFEQCVVQALMVLDWKLFSGDYEIRPSIPIGAANRITPDFVVNSADKKKLFVIEIKQPNIPITSNFQQQLFSYMRQLKLDYGLLVGQSIQIFYDGPLAQQDDPLLLDTIRFERNSEKGAKFAELFSKGSFSYDLLKDYTLESLKKINRKQDFEMLLKKISSDNYKQTILNLIKQDFISEYDGELIDSVINGLNIRIEVKNNSLESTPGQSITLEGSPRNKSENAKDFTKYIFNGQKFGKNRLVLAVIKDFVNHNPGMTYNQLKEKFPDTLQGTETFTTEAEAKRKRDRRNFISQDELIELTDTTIAVSSQWGIGNTTKFIDHCKRMNIDIKIAK